MKMYVINLDDRPDRFINVNKQFIDRGLNLIRVSAIRGKSLVDSGVETVAPPNNEAVWMSHQKVYRELIASNDQHCVVFEDDVIMTNKAYQLLKEFENVSNELPNIDYLQFGYLTYNGRLDSGEFDSVIRLRQRLRSVFYLSISKLICSIQVIEMKFSMFERLIGVTKAADNRVTRYRNMRIIAKKLKLDAPIIYSNESGGHAYIINRTLASALLNFNLPLFLVTDLATISLAKAANFDFYRTSKSLAFQDDSTVSTGLHSSQIFDIGRFL
jgi:GR25 family glycosyltransferase involved in LPS biosynthesis